MREFFKPWRRKAGVVTLAMACVFAAGWVRSLTVHEKLTISGVPGFGAFTSLESSNGLLACDRRDALFGKAPPLYTTSPQAVEFVTGTTFIPYWSILLPLTLTSAYLLLSKPRTPAPKLATQSATGI